MDLKQYTESLRSQFATRRMSCNLSFENHISHVTKTAFFHLRNIAKLRNMLSVSDAEKLVHAFMTSRLDYCNALLGGCPASSINKLQIVQNAAARVLTRSRKYDHITPILQSLHWLPIKFRISYKILLLAYKALNDLAPAYLTNLLSRYNPTRSLRSQNSGLLVVDPLDPLQFAYWPCNDWSEASGFTCSKMFIEQRQKQTGNGQQAKTGISEAEQRRKQYQAGVEVTGTGSEFQGQAVQGKTQRWQEE